VLSAKGGRLLLQLIGLGILIAGALSYADIKEVDQHLKNVDVNGSPIGLIVLGSIVFVIAFYGCCGAIRESHCMIVTVSLTALHSGWIFHTITQFITEKYSWLGGRMRLFGSVVDRFAGPCCLHLQEEDGSFKHVVFKKWGYVIGVVFFFQ
jgi:hypothetical protein